jgi:hypothetical protein
MRDLLFDYCMAVWWSKLEILYSIFCAKLDYFGVNVSSDNGVEIAFFVLF